MNYKKIGMILINNTNNYFNGVSYLEQLKKSGIKLEKIIIVNICRKSKKLDKIIPSYLNFKLGKIRMSNNFKKKKQKLYKIHQAFKEKIGTTDLYNFKFSKIYQYAENIEKFDIKSINDKILVEYLKKTEEDFYIFAGGGILRKEILNAKPFIHIHPGLVPDIKGADCLFWSILIKKKIGMSCFFMNEKIDQGDIILTKEYDYDSLSFLKPYLGKYTFEEVYLSILLFYDSYYRSLLLVEALRQVMDCDDKENSFIKQNPNSGKQYYFMHKKIKNEIFDYITKE